MDDSKDTRTSIEILIHGQRYPVSANGDEEYIRKVAAYVNDSMSQLKKTTRGNSLIRLAVLAALNITDELFNLQQDREALVKNLEERTRKLSHRLDKVLSEKV